MDQNIRWAWFFWYEIISLKMDEHGMFLIEQITTLSILTPLKWLFWGPSNTPAIQVYSPFHWWLRISSLPHCTKLICLKLCKSWGQTFFNYKPQLVLDCNSFWSINQYPDFLKSFRSITLVALVYTKSIPYRSTFLDQLNFKLPFPLLDRGPTFFPNAWPNSANSYSVHFRASECTGVWCLFGRCTVSNWAQNPGKLYPLGTVPYSPPKWHTFEVMIFLFKLVTKQCAWPRNRFLIKRFIHGTFDKSIKVSSDKKHESW